MGEALYDISTALMKAEQPNYSDLNYLICRIMSGVTASIRFPGKLNGDLRKLGVNLVPFPRLHFFTIAEAPIQASDNKAYVKSPLLSSPNKCGTEKLSSPRSMPRKE